MTKKILTLSMILVAAIFSISAIAQPSIKKQVKTKLKEYKKGGWEITLDSRTLETRLWKHYEKLDTENFQQIVGAVSMCRSINVCIQSVCNEINVAKLR